MKLTDNCDNLPSTKIIDPKIMILKSIMLCNGKENCSLNYKTKLLKVVPQVLRG